MSWKDSLIAGAFAKAQANATKAQDLAAKAALITPLTAAQAAETSVQAYMNDTKPSVMAAQAEIKTRVTPLERRALLNKFRIGQ